MRGLRHEPGAGFFFPGHTRRGGPLRRAWPWAALMIFLSGTHAEAQILTGIYCGGAAMAVVADPNVRAQCDGALYVDRAAVVRAAESITFVATGSLTQWGTLVAPRIELIANGHLSVGGGLFSGSPDDFPEVRAVSLSGTPSENLRRFGDIVSQPIIHPIYGAVTVIHQTSSYAVSASPTIEVEFVLLPEPPVNTVPEPASAVLMALGFALAAAVRRRRPG